MNIVKIIHELACAICHATGGEKEFYEMFQPTSMTLIVYDELYTLLHSKFPNAELFLGENYRFLANHNDIAVFLAQDQTNKFDYVADKVLISSYDCNVFANRLMGQFSVPGWCDLTFGKLWLTVPGHALNCVITESREFWWVEPQTDELLYLSSYNCEAVRFIEM